jgi:hypothetical protein
VRVADDEADAVEAAVDQPAEELGPEGLILGVADIDAEDLAVAVRATAGRDHDRAGDDLAVVADVHVGGVEPDIDERLVVQPAVAQHGDVVVDGLADPRHRRLADPGVTPEGFDEVVDLPRGGAGDVGAHDHRPQRLVDASAGLEQFGEERPLSQLGDADLDIPGRCRDELGAMAVALGDPQRGAFAGFGADPGGKLGLDQLLQGGLDDLSQRGGQCRVGAGQLIGELV